MTFARHLPTQRFTRDEFNAMPAYLADYDGLAEPGFSRFPDRRGKAIVVFHGVVGFYIVRPIVRVPVTSQKQ